MIWYYLCEPFLTAIEEYSFGFESTHEIAHPTAPSRLRLLPRLPGHSYRSRCCARVLLCPSTCTTASVHIDRSLPSFTQAPHCIHCLEAIDVQKMNWKFRTGVHEQISIQPKIILY